MSLLINQICNFFNETVKDSEKLKQKRRIPFLMHGEFKIPIGIHIYPCLKESKQYFKDLKKKLKLINSNQNPISSEYPENWTESDFLCDELKNINYFNQKNLTVNFSLKSQKQQKKISDMYEEWLWLNEQRKIQLEGNLEFRLPDKSIMIAKVKENKIKSFELIINKGFFLECEIQTSSDQFSQRLKFIKARFPGGFV